MAERISFSYQDAAQGTDAFRYALENVTAGDSEQITVDLIEAVREIVLDETI